MTYRPRWMRVKACGSRHPTLTLTCRRPPSHGGLCAPIRAKKQGDIPGGTHVWSMP